MTSARIPTRSLYGARSQTLFCRSEFGGTRLRELVDGEFVTVVLESAKPVEQLTVPREAVLSDQRGEFVYVVSAGDNVERRAVQLGQSTPATAVISSGLSEGERVVVEGVQRVQPGIKVAPGRPRRPYRGGHFAGKQDMRPCSQLHS